MIGHLLKKELRAQRTALIALVAFLLLLVGLALIGDLRTQSTMSTLDTLRSDLFLGVPLAALILTNGTFTRELRGRTILFMEALPVSRAALIASKLIAVTLSLILVLAPTVALVFAYSARTESLADALVADLLIRIAAWSWATLGVATLAAVLGRYRFPLYLLLFALVFIYDNAGGDASRLGPFGAMKEFAVLGATLPWEAIVESAIAGTAGFAVAAALLATRDGSVAILLGERMSHAEKLITAATLLGVVFAAHVLIEPKAKEPYALKDARAIARDGARAAIRLAPPPDVTTTATLADHLLARLDGAADWLGIAKLEPAFVVHRDDLDAQRFEIGALAEREGVLIRANLTALVDRDDLAAFLVQELLDEHTRSRAVFEPRMWVRDGGAVYAVSRDASRERRDRLLLRALYARDRGWTFADLDRWHTVRDRASRELSDAFAWSILDALAAARGDEAVQRFVRDIVGEKKPRDLRVVFAPHGGPATTRLAATAGITPAELEARWIDHLDRARARLGATLATLPVITPRLDVAINSPLQRTISVAAAVAPPLTDGRWASVIYGQLDPIADVVDRQKLERIAFDPSRSDAHALPRVFAAQRTVYVATAVYVPELACEVLGGVERKVLP